MNFSNFLKRIALQLLFWFLQTDVGRVCLLASIVIVVGLILKQTITDWWQGAETTSEAARDASPTANDVRGSSVQREVRQWARIAGVKGLAMMGRWSKRLPVERKKK